MRSLIAHSVVWITAIYMAAVTLPLGSIAGETIPTNVEVEVESIDNSSLMPRYKDDQSVALEGISPDWVKTLIMAEFRIETATKEGTFEAAVKVLDHYQEMGVNGIWINPIYERGSRGNGYLSYGPHLLEPLLTSSRSPENVFEAAKSFVDEAHRRNIRVFWDIIVWGTAKHSPLVKEHPEFYKTVDGKYVEVWGGYAFDWANQALRQWYLDKAVALIERTRADGFRVDLAPDTSGYFFREVREELLRKGHKIAIISEMNSRRDGTFDFEQVGVHGWNEEPDYFTPGVIDAQKKKFGAHNGYLLRSNIVDVIRTGVGVGKAELQTIGRGGQYRFYSSNLLHHDDREPFVRGSRLKIGYTALMAPFIPMWWIGEEWNNPKVPLPDSDGVMFFNQIDWDAKEIPSNKSFFECVKRMIRIRRSFADIFEYFPDDLRKTNIAKVECKAGGVENPLPSYARYEAVRNGETHGKRCIVVVPNSFPGSQMRFELELNLSEVNLTTFGKMKVLDLMAEDKQTDFRGDSEVISVDSNRLKFEVEVPSDSVGIYLIEGIEE